MFKYLSKCSYPELCIAKKKKKKETRPLFRDWDMKADPEKKKASVRDSCYNADIESKQSAKRLRYQEDLEKNRAAKRQRYQEDVDKTALLKGSDIKRTSIRLRC
eukprot:Em0003g1152a